jgi:hypothetical protein
MANCDGTPSVVIGFRTLTGAHKRELWRGPAQIQFSAFPSHRDKSVVQVERMAKKKNKQVSQSYMVTLRSYRCVSTRSFDLGVGIVNESLKMKRVRFLCIDMDDGND